MKMIIMHLEELKAHKKSKTDSQMDKSTTLCPLRSSVVRVCTHHINPTVEPKTSIFDDQTFLLYGDTAKNHPTMGCVMKIQISPVKSPFLKFSAQALCQKPSLQTFGPSHHFRIKFADTKLVKNPNFPNMVIVCFR